MIGVKREVIDKESEAYLEYQLELKQCIFNRSQYRSDLQQCFSMILKQCSPAVERNLEGDESYK